MTIHAVCPSCAAVNRVERERASQATCGKCQSALLPAKPVVLTESTFDRFIGKSELPVLVDFWAPWCGPCKMMAPQYDQAAVELAGEVILAKVDTQAEQSLGARFSIHSVPTMMVFRNGSEVTRQSGAMNANDIVRWTRSL